MKFLIIDDSRTARLVTRKSIQMVREASDGDEFFEAANGSEGMEQLKTHGADLIICDINMPVMSGFTFLRNLRFDEKTKEVPIAFVTSMANESRNENLEGLGALAVLKKPLKLSDITHVLKMISTSTTANTNDEDDGWGD